MQTLYSFSLVLKESRDFQMQLSDFCIALRVRPLPQPWSEILIQYQEVTLADIIDKDNCKSSRNCYSQQFIFELVFKPTLKQIG